MSTPFGFGPGTGGGEGSGGSGDPFGLGAFGDPSQMAEAFAQIGRLLSWQGGPVNWDLARDTARQAVAGGDPSPSFGDRSLVEQALRLAELWLDDATTLPAAGGRVEAWSRAEWVERTLPVWHELAEPVAERVQEAMTAALRDQLSGAGAEGLPPGMEGLLGAGVSPETFAQQLQSQLGPMLKAMSASMFGAQVGQALGALAGEVVGSTDVGLPLAGTGRSALLPSGVAAFGAGLEVPEEEVRVFLALREAAHQRLYAAAGWLRPRLLGDVTAYARGIAIDAAAIESAVSQLDPSDPAAVQEALGSGLFAPDPTPEQQLALTRLETLLALVEGWVDTVTAAAAEPHLKHAAALREAVRRRRATGGPAEQTFANLVGLELRPRRLRDAARLWELVARARGTDGRDALWTAPDLMPGTSDLDEPELFASTSSVEVDLDELLGPDGDGPQA
ncbi:putative hydrolase [Motilibacter rhizosphaerae]|uniref:Putative hydrolase n=1 Tax=Motilibacter rhizosphaerae TaxID=598652 RepID=A0A4Q7NQ25_9ACTN|nr:zinc-dependent metalloprotease [Motilibacter rhizosphaerae]RZS87178.1 putative hydrolase [Motilibacter rhizosphaerae]